MKKETEFLWGWNDYQPQPDTSMTRARAAKLLRAWRRSRTQGVKNFYLQRIGKGHYRVAARGYENEAATMIFTQHQ